MSEPHPAADQGPVLLALYDRAVADVYGYLLPRCGSVALAPQHRAALTLRYLDGLSVPDVADLLGRGVHAAEALLVRARTAFRRAYDHDGGR